MSWIRLTLGAMWVAAICQTIFVLIYGLGPWRRDFVGKALFFKSASLAAALIFYTANAYLSYGWQREAGAILMCLVAAAIVYQLVALIRQRLIARREDRAARGFGASCETAQEP